MPNPQIKSYSEKYEVPIEVVEDFWEKAKEQYGEDWSAVSGTVKKMCKNYNKKNESNFDKALNILSEKVVDILVSDAKMKEIIADLRDNDINVEWEDTTRISGSSPNLSAAKKYFKKNKIQYK